MVKLANTPIIRFKKDKKALVLQSKILKRVKAHTDRTRFGNATQIFSFQKQIKPSTDKNFTRYANQIAEIAKWSRIFEKQSKILKLNVIEN
jgi:hypothetical protein